MALRLVALACARVPEAGSEAMTPLFITYQNALKDFGEPQGGSPRRRLRCVDRGHTADHTSDNRAKS